MRLSDEAPRHDVSPQAGFFINRKTMGLPSSPEARIFYQAAKQRLEDASYLLEAKRTTGAVYLAGYAVECMFKAMILDSAPRRERKVILEGFRGAKGHDLESLSALYSKRGAKLPAAIAIAMRHVMSWSTELRYMSGRLKDRESAAFLRYVHEVVAWSDERL